MHQIIDGCPKRFCGSGQTIKDRDNGKVRALRPHKRAVDPSGMTGDNVLNGFTFSEKRLILCRALQKQQPVVSNGAAKVFAATNEDNFAQKSIQFGLVHRHSSR